MARSILGEYLRSWEGAVGLAGQEELTAVSGVEALPAVVAEVAE